MNLISLFMPLILCFTVVVSVSFGVLAAYALVIGILHSFGHAAQPEAPAQHPRLVLVATQNPASGD